jgi:hypothetical protein
MSDRITRRRETRGSGADNALQAGGALRRERHVCTPEVKVARSKFTRLRQQRSRASVSCARVFDCKTGFQSSPLGALCGATRLFGID